MGLHDPETQVQAKALWDIPEEEPIFVLRGQDISAITTLEDYLINCEVDGASEDFQEGVKVCIDDFRKFRKENEDRMKIPDLPGEVPREIPQVEILGTNDEDNN